MPPQTPAARLPRDSPSPPRWPRRERRPPRCAALRHATRSRTHVLRIRLYLFERCSCPESRLSTRGLQLMFTLVRPVCPLRSLCPLCKILSFSPPQHRPLIPPSNPRQIARRIHRRRLSDHIEHPLVTRTVSIRKASPQIQILCRSDS